MENISTYCCIINKTWGKCYWIFHVLTILIVTMEINNKLYISFQNKTYEAGATGSG